jgi:predicted phosphodiesterase
MDIKNQVIAARHNGMTYSQIYDEFGIAKSTARDWYSRYIEDSYQEIINDSDTPVGYVNDNLQRDKPSRFKKTEDEVLEFLAQLAPIKVTPKYANQSTITLSDYAVVGSDFHFGCHDPKAIDIFLETIFQIKPKTIILNGDTMDFLAISKYPKDLKHNWSLQKEREEYHAFLDELIGVSGGADIYETVSNHSGQSVGGRWRRYLSDRIGELACLPEITETLSYENVFMGDYKNRIKHVDYVDLNGLIVTHGETVRSAGGASCLAEVNKWGASILHGHTHRLGMSVKRIPAIGNRSEQQLYGFESGCLCSLDAAYGSGMNWNQGFSIVSLDQDGHTFGVEQVSIIGGVSNISTLGKTIRV